MQESKNEHILISLNVKKNLISVSSPKDLIENELEGVKSSFWASRLLVQPNELGMRVDWVQRSVDHVH